MYRFISDPGHGWLEVPRKEIDQAGIAGKVSKFSYQSIDGEMVYLEEDCDAYLFLKAIGRELMIQELHQEKTFIRNLPRYEVKS